MDLEDLDIEDMIMNSSQKIRDSMMDYPEEKIQDSLLHQMVNFSQEKVVLSILKLGGKMYEKTIYLAF